ncbi:MAG: FAD-dependent oxidoreductase [Candidatus Bathyarchaeia archaeon]
MQVKRLWEPINIGNVTVANRIAMAPTNDNLALPDGAVSEEQIRYWERRAAGGAGLLVAGNAYVAEKSSKITLNQMACYHDKFIPRLRRLTDAVHAHGVKVFLQIVHGGRQAAASASTGDPLVSASTVAAEGKEAPRELTGPEVKEVVASFTNAADRAVKANFDGVEIHCAYGYLLSSFISPYTNRRRDEYGGRLEGRMRVPLEIVQNVRRLAGGDFAVGVRFNGNDYIEGGVTPDIAEKEAAMFEKAGADYLAVSGGFGSETPYMVEQPMYVERATSVYLAERIRKLVKVPVMTVGSINDPLLAESILADGKADIIGMARPLIVDPDLPRKVKENRLEDILRCIRCNECMGAIFEAYIKCALNPEVGNEGRYPIEKADASKRVLVIGGGPAGMEAALIAAKRGHRVTLCEKNEKLGGAFLPRRNPPFKRELENIPEYFATQLAKFKVDVKLNFEVKAEDVRRMNPDVVIAATGATYLIPPTVGMDKPHVKTAVEILSKDLPPQQHIVVVGGGMLGCETALHLAQNSKKVTMVTRRDKTLLGEDCNAVSRKWLLNELKQIGVDAVDHSEIETVTDEGVTCVDRNRNKKSVAADLVVIARGFEPNRTLGEQLRDYEVHYIGDAVETRNIMAAIHEGFHLGRRI